MRVVKHIFTSTVQIAGVKNLAEARLLESLGVDFIGFPLRLGYHKPDVSEEMAKTIIDALRAPNRAVLITYETSAKALFDLCRFLNVSITQLHGDISPEDVKQLRRECPKLIMIKSLIVRPEFGSDAAPLLEMANRYEAWVDAFITDTFDPRTTACGATGLLHDWTISRTLARELTKPLILAGGLNPRNVYDAIKEVQPAAVDSHTGVEGSEGEKLSELVASFLSEARRAFGPKDPTTVQQAKELR
jgi:phosphoribosylanthranilate isomerase